MRGDALNASLAVKGIQKAPIGAGGPVGACVGAGGSAAAALLVAESARAVVGTEDAAAAAARAAARRSSEVEAIVSMGWIGLLVMLGAAAGQAAAG